MKQQSHTTRQQLPSVQLMRAVIFTLSIVLYGYTVTFDYTLDDALMISKNQYTLKGINGLKEIFSEDAFAGFFGKDKQLVAGGRYRPLTHAMFAIEYELFGLNPFVGHLINVILYALLALIIFETLRLYLNKHTITTNWKQYIPFVATLLFVVHPLHTEVVANIKGRDEIMALIGAMSAMYFSHKFFLSRNPLFLFISFMLFLIGLFSKENAITFLVVIPLSLWMFASARLKDVVITSIPLVIASVIFIFARYKALGYLMSSSVQTEILNNPFIYATKAQELATVLFTWLVYFKLLFFPHPLTHDYYPWHFQILNFSEPIVWLAIALIVLLAILTIRNFRTHPLISYGILFFAITFSIQSNLLFNIGTFMNERFVFAPLLGWCIIVAYLFSRWILSAKNIASALLVILIGAFSAKTFSRSLVWKDNLTLFTTDVKISHNSAKCNVSAGEALIQAAEKQKDTLKAQQMFRQAYQYLLKAQQIHPTYFGAYDLAGKAAFHLNKYDESFRHYQQCLVINPQAPVPLHNIYLVALAAIHKQQFELAEQMLRWAIDFAPDSLHYQLELAQLYERKGNIQQSIQTIQNILQRDSTNARAWAKLGELYGRYLNNLNAAEQFLLQSIKFDSNLVTAIENLGVVYGLRRDFNKSLTFFLKAVSLSPNESRIHRNLANTYLQLNQPQKAAYHFEKANQLDAQKK